MWTITFLYMSHFMISHLYSITMKFISDIKYILRFLYMTYKISSSFEYCSCCFWKFYNQIYVVSVSYIVERINEICSIQFYLFILLKSFDKIHILSVIYFNTIDSGVTENRHFSVNNYGFWPKLIHNTGRRLCTKVYMTY